MFDFSEALSFMKAGFKVINSRGDVYYINDNKIYCIPQSQYPKGNREVIKMYSDSILTDNWSLLDE